MNLFATSGGTMDPRLRPMIVVLAMITLLAYVGTFFSHAAAILRPDLIGLRIGSGEGLDHVWTSASVLVGSIIAIALGQPVDQARRPRGWFEDRLIIFYAWGWLAVGVTACTIWALKTLPSDELLIKNAATAFIGLLIPVVSTFFREQGGQAEALGAAAPLSVNDPIAANLEHREGHGRAALDFTDLGLAEHALSAAQALKTKHPSIVFTSGRRSVVEQADAMAPNIVRNRQWIAETYAVSAERGILQKWVDDNPGATTRAAIAAGLSTIMDTWSDLRRVKLSRHFAGLAFDVRPGDAAIKTSIEALPNLVRFLDNEGGIVIWHAEFGTA